jgi:hypothetical protein
MVSSESERGQGPTPPLRSEGDQQRRRNIADAAADVWPGETPVPAEAGRIERFRCVIYLCGAPNADIAGPRKECTDYAVAFGWEIAGEFLDGEGLLPATGREGLSQAVELIRSRQAGVLLTPWRSMISPIPQEYDQVAREVEKAGGFLHVMDTDRPRPRTEPC